MFLSERFDAVSRSADHRRIFPRDLSYELLPDGAAELRKRNTAIA